MSGTARLIVALLAALACAWLLGGGRPELALLGWLPSVIFAVSGHWFNGFALSPGRPAMLALAGQVVRVFVMAVVLVCVMQAQADGGRAFAKAGLGAFAIVWLAEILELVLRSLREAQVRK